MYLLRSKQLGLTLDEMDQLDEGMVYDLLTESGNDNAADSYREVATQSDFDKF